MDGAAGAGGGERTRDGLSFLPLPELGGSGTGFLHEAISDLFRLYDPSRLSSVVDLIAEYGGDEEGLKGRLEASLGVPGFFGARHLHFGSRFFDAPRALYDEAFVPPYPDARPLDNISKAACLLPVPDAAAGSATASRPLFGKLHAESRGESDAAWWRGDVPGTLLDWLASALPPGPMAACLQPWIRDRVCVRVLTRQVAADGSASICAWRGHIKGADADGNVLLVGVQRHTVAVVDPDGGGSVADAGGEEEHNLQVLLVGDSILSIGRGQAEAGAAPPSRNVDHRLRR
jgi:hypothetical protein